MALTVTHVFMFTYLSRSDKIDVIFQVSRRYGKWSNIATAGALTALCMTMEDSIRVASSIQEYKTGCSVKRPVSKAFVLVFYPFGCRHNLITHDFRVPPQCESGPHSFGMLSSVNWQFVTEDSGQLLGSILFLECSSIENGNCRLYRSVGKYQWRQKNIPENPLLLNSLYGDLTSKDFT